jgi:hypothetical protein
MWAKSTGTLFVQMKPKYKRYHFFHQSSLHKHVFLLHLEWSVSEFRRFTPGKGPVYP